MGRLFFFLPGCAGSSLLNSGFLQLQGVGPLSSCGVRPSPCGGFSRCRAQALGSRASTVAAWELRRLGSVVVAHGLSAPQHVEPSCTGIEPVYPALASGFLTTELPGKVMRVLLLKKSSERVGCSVMADLVTPWTVAHQAPLSMGFSR